MSDIGWDDLRVRRFLEGTDATYMEHLLAEERDVLGRAWLREKIGPEINLHLTDAAIHHAIDKGPQTSIPINGITFTSLRSLLRAVLDALDGGQE